MWERNLAAYAPFDGEPYPALPRHCVVDQVTVVSRRAARRVARERRCGAAWEELSCMG